MKRNILYMAITGLMLFVLASKVEGAAVAGDSANLAFNFKTDKSAIQNAVEFRKRMAIKAVLEKYNSPMADQVDSFMNACKKYSLDCYLLPSIAGLESTFGQFIYPGSYNPFGWGRGLIVFNNWSEAIDTVGEGLKTNYIDRGATTIDEIGAIYCEGNTWAGKIKWFMREFEKEEAKLTLYTASFPVQL